MSRTSGVLLPLAALPSRFGIGDLGPEAYAFADFLCRADQQLWQILPFNEPLQGQNSPYHSVSAFAGNGLLVSPEILVDEGLLGQSSLERSPSFPEGTVDYEGAREHRGTLFREARARFLRSGDGADYETFCNENAGWLDDYALFKALKERFDGRPWHEWPEEYRDREAAALAAAGRETAELMDEEKFIQYIFFRQWMKLKSYCSGRGIRIFGDLAIYVEHDSADVWRHREIFKLKEDCSPAFVSGVPPDYFSSTGQLWGHPVYDWASLRKQGYGWWLARIAHNMKLCDILRIDHFRGLVAYWEVKAGEKTALGGTWVDAPSEEFFSLLRETFPGRTFIAEDLGVITPDVTEAMDRFGFPGMRVLLFAFAENDPAHPYLPHNYVPDTVAYTGTHDTNTVRGWFEDEASDGEKARLCRYLGREVTAGAVSWELVRLALGSVAERAVLPMQDLLGLDAQARMNRPGTIEGNYLWRLRPGQADGRLEESLRELTERYGRLPVKERG